MKHYDDMSPRERDAWGAEHVMGYVVYKGYDVYDGVIDKKSPYRMLCSPEYFAKWTQKFGPSDEGISDDVNLITFRMSNYSTDASADYEILKKVRETWEVIFQNAFAENLHTSILAIRKTKHPRGLSRNDLLFYEPGDYLHAAWMALNDGE